ncbi:unnamed protein product, partial [Ectocarpus sp. 13 AM-2016]
TKTDPPGFVLQLALGTSIPDPVIAQVNPRRLSHELAHENVTAHHAAVKDTTSSSSTPQSRNRQITDSISLLANTPNNTGELQHPGALNSTAVNPNPDLRQQYNSVDQA